MVLHFDGDRFALVLNLGRHVVIILLRLVDVKTRVIVHGFLVPLANWYQDVETGPETVSPTRRGCWRVLVLAPTMARAAPLLATATMTAGIGIIQRHNNIVRLQTRLPVFGYIRRASRRSRRVHLLWRKFVFHPFTLYCGPQVPYVTHSGVGLHRSCRENTSQPRSRRN